MMMAVKKERNSFSYNLQMAVTIFCHELKVKISGEEIEK